MSFCQSEYSGALSRGRPTSNLKPLDTFKEFIGDDIVSTGYCIHSEFSIPRTKFGRGNVITCGCVFCELFEITTTFKNSVIAEDDTMTEDQGVSMVLTNGLVWPNKGMDLANAHDDIGILVGIVSCADSVW